MNTVLGLCFHFQRRCKQSFSLHLTLIILFHLNPYISSLFLQIHYKSLFSSPFHSNLHHSSLFFILPHLYSLLIVTSLLDGTFRYSSLSPPFTSQNLLIITFTFHSTSHFFVPSQTPSFLLNFPFYLTPLHAIPHFVSPHPAPILTSLIHFVLSSIFLTLPHLFLPFLSTTHLYSLFLILLHLKLVPPHLSSPAPTNTHPRPRPR